MGYTDEYKQKRTNQLLRLLDITALKNLKAITLSSGQKQRVAIARSLAEFPKVYSLFARFTTGCSTIPKTIKTRSFKY